MEYPDLGVDESYEIDVVDDKINVVAKTPFGALQAFETLIQLVSVGPSTFFLSTTIFFIILGLILKISFKTKKKKKLPK